MLTILLQDVAPIAVPESGNHMMFLMSVTGSIITALLGLVVHFVKRDRESDTDKMMKMITLMEALKRQQSGTPN